MARVPPLGLQDSSSADPAGRILNALLIGVLIWVAVYGIVFLPRFAARPVAAGLLVLLLAITAIVALTFLRHGALRNSAATFLSGTCLTAMILVYWSGGIRSPALVLFASVPICAAWLLGYRSALLFSGACLLWVLGMAIAEMTGHLAPRYFTGTPLGTWAVFALAIIIAALPVVVILRTLNDSLAAARLSIAELREAEEALRRERDLVQRIMETGPVGIMALDREGRITFMNSSAERIFGISRAEAARRAYNDSAWRVTSHDGAPYPDDELPFRQVQQHRGVLNDVRLAISRPDGRRVLLSVNAAPVLTLDGKFDGMVSSMEDMTERARLDEELRKYREGLEELVRHRTEELVQARDQAMAANHAKSAFLANMSHEFRTPLNAILGLCTLIGNDSALSADHHRKLRIIHRSGEHLLDLINDVLDMAKMEAGAVAVTNVLADLDDLFSGVVELMRPRAEEKGLKIFLHQSPARPQFVHADAAKIRQILVNLISNAIRCTQQGHVSVRVDGKAGETMQLKFEVADTGPGISPEDRERIFDSFVQVGSHLAGGTGLGLAITRQHVERMGGAIDVDSAPGGSRFTVSLPVVLADPATAFPAGARREIVHGLAPDQPKFRILIVEDQRENRIVLHQLLSGAGFQVRAVEDGAAAIKTFRTWRPQFIWMDWRLPVMDGEQATRAIRAAPGGADVRIAAVTASVFPEERERILSAGVDDVVRKPFRPGEIFACMARLLGVRYFYADSAASSGADTELNPEALRTLPEALRAEIVDALISLDVEAISNAIGRASQFDPDLGRALARAADSLEFTAILTALRQTDRARKGCA